MSPAEYITSLIEYAWSLNPELSVYGLGMFVLAWFVHVCVVLGLISILRIIWHTFIFMFTGRQICIAALKTRCEIGYTRKHLEICVRSNDDVRVSSYRDGNDIRIILN